MHATQSPFIRGYIDEQTESTVKGWCFDVRSLGNNISVSEDAGKPIDCQIIDRQDVVEFYRKRNVENVPLACGWKFDRVST